MNSLKNASQVRAGTIGYSYDSFGTVIITRISHNVHVTDIYTDYNGNIRVSGIFIGPGYDLRGDRITENDVTEGIVTHNEYTVEGQLRSVSEEDANGTNVIQQNAYDADGTRVQKTEGNDVKKYYYAGNDMICTTENGDPVFTGAYDSSEIVGAYLGETPEYMLYSKDIQGSTDLLLDGSLEEVGRYTYTDYGEVTALEGTPAYNEICYTGAVYDRTTGEHYLRARYYDPDSAVFTTQDTLRGEAADSSLWNSYAYCNGDPVNKVDLNGHYSVKKAVKYAHDWSAEGRKVRNPEYDDYGSHADCTNFVSQCVHAGGIAMNMPKSHPINSIHNTNKFWYAKMPPKRPHYIFSTSTE